jgi:hypothetical protein
VSSKIKVRNNIYIYSNTYFTLIILIEVTKKSKITGARDNGDVICSSTDGQIKPISIGHDILARWV